jgi:hypothetical protein
MFLLLEFQPKAEIPSKQYKDNKRNEKTNIRKESQERVK